MRLGNKALPRLADNFGASMEQTIGNMFTAQGVVRRREILLAAAMAPALAFAYGPAQAAAPDPAAGFLGAVVDRRFPQGLAFAERAKNMGTRTFGFAGDISSLWFDHLLPALQANTAPFIGLTDPGALFCFEQLAWNAGMRVRFRLDHRESDGAVQHFASADLPSWLRAPLADADRAYGARAADVALASHAAWSDCTHAVVPATGFMGAQALVSWVIAA
jgi:hypothetical protein